MEKANNKDNQLSKFGKSFVNWSYKEFEPAQKGNLWFIMMGLVGGLFLVSAVLSKNWLFAVIIILVYFIIFLRQSREPEEIKIDIREKGIIIDEFFYAYYEIKKYWIIYEPPTVKTLYIELNKTFSTLKKIRLEQVNPLFIREIFNNVLEEDLEKNEEPFADTLGRWLKL